MPSRIAIAKSSHFACISRGSGFSAWGSPAPDPASREAACAILHEASHPAITIVRPARQPRGRHAAMLTNW